jgi:threonine synthase
MGIVTRLTCVKCGESFREGESETTCLHCGIEGILDVDYDYSDMDSRAFRRSLERNPDRSLWRYLPVLPLAESAVLPSLPVGGTPLFRSRRLETLLNLPTLFIKDDGRNPSASLKDRASAIAVARAIAAGRTVVACASTGNAATSLAGFAAHTGLEANIFVPAAAPPAKRAQLSIYGARVFLVEGSYADAFTVATAAIERFGWYNRNCAINPYLVEGKKTVAWEFAEQTGWNPPDLVFAPIGDGCTIAGIYKGFYEAHLLGFIAKVPRIIGVQAAGAAPIYHAWKNRAPLIPQPAETIADSISVGHPRNHLKAIRAVDSSKGEIITVTDEEILEAMAILARHAGVFGEPSGVTGFAGLRRFQQDGKIGPEESAGIIVTGHGLKDIAAAARVPGKNRSIPATVDSIERILDSV